MYVNGRLYTMTNIIIYTRIKLLAHEKVNTYVVCTYGHGCLSTYVDSTPNGYIHMHVQPLLDLCWDC